MLWGCGWFQKKQRNYEMIVKKFRKKNPNNTFL